MSLTIIRKLGEGAFADVWEAQDELDRRVAVKIIRESVAYEADALAHAKALARIDHPNIVRVHQLARVKDPEDGKVVDCVVMELVEGETLRAMTRRKRLTRDEVRRIGRGLIDGLEEIHKHGLAHGDLHTENIMVGENSVKILDILYRESLAILATIKRQERLDRDIRALRLIIQEVISHSELDPAEAAEFNARLGLEVGLADLRREFDVVTSEEHTEDAGRQLENAYSRFIEEPFVDTQEYAFALSEATPRNVTFSLLRKVVHENSYLPSRGLYVQQLWLRLEDFEKAAVIADLSGQLEANLPKGKWWPALQMLVVIGESAWKLLPRLVQLKLEGLIVNDVLAGYYDIYAAGPQTKGALGTYANTLWRFFSAGALVRLVDNLVTLLRQGWYTQNYVGKHFMSVLAPIAEASGKKQLVFEALYEAIKNDARIINNEVKALPEDWRREIDSREEEEKKQRAKVRAPWDNDDIPF